LPSSGVRVKLDLSDFVLDVGARRWILLIPGKMVTVSDLLEKIRGEYGQVKEGDTLTVFLEDQFMVPPWEPLAILKEGDLLRVTLSQGDRSIPGPPDAKRQKMGTDDKKKANRENPAKRVVLKKNPVDKNDQIEEKSGKSAAAAPESSSSSDSSSEEETGGVNNAAEKKSEPVKESSSSESESDSEEEAEGILKKSTVNSCTALQQTQFDQTTYHC